MPGDNLNFLEGFDKFTLTIRDGVLIKAEGDGPLHLAEGQTLFTEIGPEAFSNGGVTSLKLPGVTSVEEFALCGCKQLVDVSLPDATDIGESALAECSKLNKAHLPLVRIVEKEAFSLSGALPEINLPEVEVIEDDAFSQCPSLQDLRHTEALQHIGEDAFYRCHPNFQQSLLKFPAVDNTTAWPEAQEATRQLKVIFSLCCRRLFDAQDTALSAASSEEHLFTGGLTKGHNPILEGILSLAADCTQNLTPKLPDGTLLPSIHRSSKEWMRLYRPTEQPEQAEQVERSALAGPAPPV